ncbi:DUF805 domain-containing protein [Cutibacterium sp. WCA-380-WT-3A]|uniref:DUF805 domain-containing protein n=1 Tax=Cutibacterium porci TaxID=2605781 RepID=A0A7K0J5N5_9ACTN|nr:DUF805 domain-containing protein [Cutibacterium porci]MSS45260.1 DUF805 domain-containing protein [Cutibacterium porci]
MTEPNDPYRTDNAGTSAWPSQSQHDPYGQTSSPYGMPNPYGDPAFGADGSNHRRPNVSFGRAIKLFFKNYAVFHGRASRSEYWWVALFSALVNVALNIINTGTGGTNDNPTTVYLVLAAIWSLGTLIPGLSLAVRRLHDANRSGFHLFWLLLPFIGWIVLLVFFCQNSHPDAWHKYDDGPLPAED